MIEIFLASFATLFVIIDPIGIGAISLSLLGDRTPSERRVIIWRAAIVAFFILLIFGLAGETLLDRIGISMPAFRISGGLLLLLTALEMLFGSRVERRSNVGSERPDPSIYPLAMPLLAGPGAMTAMILMIGEEAGDWVGQSIVIGTLLIVLLLTVILAFAFNRFSHHLGSTGIEILNRFLAIILAALAVQFMADGVFEYIRNIS